ncbi:MAG: ComEC/Rec2 family competence protein [Oscillospiraceae bacterium]|nr:ComEC/Rec2 family competence protein [Oscillospiraceae bacterium]
MKFSMVLLAAVMITAVIGSYMFGVFIMLLIMAVFLTIFIFRSVLKRNLDISMLVLILGFAAACVSFGIHTGSISHPISLYTGRYAVLSGTVMSNPEESNTSDNLKYTVRINEITIKNTKSSVNDTILVSSKERLRCGDKIRFSGIINDFPGQMNENGFDSTLYYKSQNIYNRIYAEDIECSGSTFVLSPFFISQKFTGMIDNVIYKYLSGDEAATVSAILTGNTHHFSAGFNSVLNKTAFKRMLHPAYIHIWLLITLVELICGFINKKRRDIIAAIVIGIYAVMSCTNIGFTRCLIMIAMTMVCRNRNGDAHYPDILAEIFIICAITMPTMIFNVKLILSSTAGLLIWAFGPHIQKRLYFLAPSRRRMTAVMIICALFLTPLSSVYFSGVCIYSFLAPFIMMPLVLIMLFLAPFVYILLLIFGSAPIIGGYFKAILWIIMKLPYLICRLPFSNIILGKPSLSVFLLIISIIFMIYYYFKDKNIHLKYSAAAAMGLFISVIISSLLRIGTTDFIFVNVGQGDGAVIHTAYGATVIIDGGGGNGLSSYNPGESVFVPYLEDKGYYNIDAAFISHFHRDHVQGVIAAIKELNVKNVFYLPPEDDDNELSEWFNELKAAAEENGTKLCPLTENTRISFDCGQTFDVYLPNSALLDEENDTSILIKASYGNTDVLYTGDITAESESEFLKYNIDVNSDVLKVGHHGSSTSTSQEWYEAVSPDFAVISCGENNSYGHPAKQTLETLKSVRILRTDLDGDIKITADKSRIRRVSIFK